MLTRFSSWFGSSGGVWQTIVIVSAWYGLEIAGLLHDPQHFQLCVLLTIYSTQPVLAYANRQDTAQGDALLAEIRAIAQRIDGKEDLELAIIGSDDE
jgi:hypothetical protein